MQHKKTSNSSLIYKFVCHCNTYRKWDGSRRGGGGGGGQSITPARLTSGIQYRCQINRPSRNEVLCRHRFKPSCLIPRMVKSIIYFSLDFSIVHLEHQYCQTVDPNIYIQIEEKGLSCNRLGNIQNAERQSCAVGPHQMSPKILHISQPQSNRRMIIQQMMREDASRCYGNGTQKMGGGGPTPSPKID